MTDPGDGLRTRALLRLAREITARRDLDDVLTETLRELRTVLDFGGGSIQLVDDEGWITVAAADPPVAEDVLATRVPIGNSVAGRIVLTEQAIYVPDVRSDARSGLPPLPQRAAEIRSYLAVPLIADGRAIGLLWFDSAAPDAFSASEQTFLLAAAMTVAAAIQNARSQAAAHAARVRADGLERRLDQIRDLLAAARVTSSRSDQQLSTLLTALEGQLGEAVTVEDLFEAPPVSTPVTL
jgi:GAF domain-containing protein